MSPGSPQPHYSNLQLRVMSAAVLAAVVLALTWLGGVWFTALAVIIGAASLYEWLRIAGMKDKNEVAEQEAILEVYKAALGMA